jgi:hypothetical protein
MTAVTVSFETPLAVALAAGDANPTPRTITGLAVPFGVPSAFPDSLTRRRYQFDGPPANLTDLVDVVRGHDPAAVVGRLAAPWEPDETGMPGKARIFATTAGNDVLVEAQEHVLTGFSVSAEIDTFTEDPAGVRVVAAGDYTINHLGIVRGPAFTESAGLSVAAAAALPDPEATARQLAHLLDNRKEPTMTTTHEASVVELPTIAELAAEVSTMLAAEAPRRHPLAEFDSERAYNAAFLDAVQSNDLDRQRTLVAAFAVADQITTDNPGVIPPGWRTEIKANLDSRRPAIRGVGSIGLPPAGMDSNWPYYAGNLDAIIGVQAAEKTDLAGPKISILKATAPIKTAGVVTDISYQLLMRSSPAYLTAYLAICRAAWARYTEKVFELALFAGGTASASALPTTGDTFAGALFTMSAEVEDATGSPASVVGVAKDLWLALGKLPNFRNPAYNTSNVAGVSSAATLRIDINGLAVERWPFLANGSMVVTNDQAAKFAETGPMVADSENVVKLGRDVATWGMYEDAEIYFPAGVRKLTGVAPPVPDALAVTTGKK